MARYEAIPYSKVIEKHILTCIEGGVLVDDMLASIQELQSAPASMGTLYKIYGSFIFRERAKLKGMVGKKVIDQAMQGDFKSQELFLRSRGGWSPTHTVNEVEQEIDPELDVSASDQLMSLLGFEPDEEEE